MVDFPALAEVHGVFRRVGVIRVFSSLFAALAATALLAACAGLTPAAPASAAARPDPDAPVAGGMLAIAPHVYVDRGMPRERVAKLLNIVMKARVRAAFFYGDLLARPDIFFCSSMACYREFGAVGLGYTVGNDIAIAPDGARAAILSHELSHAELAARLGVREGSSDRVPQWFDEGLAVVVSLAHEYSDEAWLQATHNGESSPSLDELSGRAGWNRITGADGRDMQLSYGTARQEVLRWFDKVGRDGLQQLIEDLKERKNFQAAYRSIEKACDARQVRRAQPGIFPPLRAAPASPAPALG